MVDFHARGVLEMLDYLFARRVTVDSREVRYESAFHDLGTDGETAVRKLPPGIYTREGLYDALVDCALTPQQRYGRGIDRAC